MVTRKLTNLRMMSTKTRAMTELMTRHCVGRMLLHLICICRGGDVRFHSAAIRHQLRTRPAREAECHRA